MVLLKSILMVLFKIIFAIFCFAAGGAGDLNFKEVPKRSQKAAAMIFMILVAFTLVCVFFAVFSAR